MKEEIKNTTTLTEEEIIRFQTFHMNVAHRGTLIFNILLCVILFIMGAVILIKDHNNWGYAYFLLGVIYLVYRLMMPKQTAKLMIARDPNVLNLTNTYVFGKKDITVSGNDFSSKVTYDKVYRIYETNQNFYLYMDRNQAYILAKDGFEQGKVEELTKFLKQKLQKKFKDKKKEVAKAN